MKTILHKYNNKAIARKAYNAGETIILYANKVRPNNMWIQGHEISIESIKEAGGIASTDFDTIVNTFEYYNCRFETGYYTSFYVNVTVSRD